MVQKGSKMNKKPKKNKARCKNCGDVIESKYRHDFVTCSCFTNDGDTGFFLDGGKDYCRYGGNFSHIEWLDE